jgi:hypothetical protein
VSRNLNCTRPIILLPVPHIEVHRDSTFHAVTAKAQLVYKADDMYKLLKDSQTSHLQIIQH